MLAKFICYTESKDRAIDSEVPSTIIVSCRQLVHHSRKDGFTMTHLDLCEPVEPPLVIKEAELSRSSEDIAVLRERTFATHHGHKVVLLELTQKHRTTSQHWLHCLLEGR